MPTFLPQTKRQSSSTCRRSKYLPVMSVVFFLAACISGPQAQTLAPLSIVGPTRIRIGGHANYSAIVNGVSSSVNWWVNGFPGGDASCGTISSSGVYSPGPQIYAGHSVTISAATVSTPMSSASLIVKVLNQLPTLTSGSVTQTAAGTSFLLDAHGSAFVAGAQLFVAGVEVPTVFISSTELQSAISLPMGTTTVSVGVLNPNAAQKTPVIRTLAVQLNAVPTVSVALTPSNVDLTLSQSQPFTVTVTGTLNTAVTWIRSPSVGTIFPGGVYTAPASIPSAQMVTVSAMSAADPSKVASASIALAPPTGVSYYVSNSGSDSNNGTSPDSPWKTIAHVNAQSFNPGDSIFFQAGGMWREELSMPYSWTGSQANPITFGSYGTGNLPIISGSNLLSIFTPSSGAYYTPYTTAPNQIFRNGLRLYRVATQGTLVTGTWWLDTNNFRIWVYDNPSGQTLEASQRTNAIYSACSATVYITLSGLQTEQANGDGIVTCGGGVWTLTGGVSNNNWGSGVHLQDSIAPSTITNYTANYNGADGFELYDTPGLVISDVTANYNVQQPADLYLAGIKWDPSSGSVSPIVENSTACHNAIAQPGYGMPSQASYITGSGIWADTIGTGWIVRNNTTCGNNERGIDIDADNYAFVYGNVSYSNLESGIIAYADASSSMTGHQIFNNTVWGNKTGIVMQGPDAGETIGGCESNHVQNNISYDSTNYDFQANVGCENPGSDGSGNIYTYNAFGGAAANFILWGNLQYSAYADWETATGNCGTIGCAHSMESDPMLVDASGALFSLQSGSPAIGAGVGGGDLGAVPHVN
jgi:hypothetical protein